MERQGGAGGTFSILRFRYLPGGRGEERKTRSKSAVKNVPTGCDTLMVELSPSLVLLMGGN